MEKQTKLRIRKHGTRIEVMVLVKHPMRTGTHQDNETRQPVPADYIEKMTFALNNVVVAEARMGPGVAEDPLTGITLQQARPGDRVTVNWIDSRSESGSAAATVP